MMARRGVMGLLAGAATLVLGGCGILEQGATYRYRITIEVETPEGIRTGSAVHEQTATLTSLRIGDSTGKGAITRAEAVVVDLPGGPIFALLTLPDAKGPLPGVVTVALDPDAGGGMREDYINAVRGLGGWFGGASAELPREDWPMMVRFRDIDDPTSVERVDPEAAGVKRILLETTGDDVTTGIEERLGWLDRANGSLSRRLSAPDPTNPPFSAQIHGRDFSTELFDGR